jgi:DNA-binding CsgD family transcriptional regulator/tetratricopeptide (TPR) repeat protein
VIFSVRDVPFVGRAAELDACTAALAAGGGSWILVTGEPGIGKSALAARGGEIARAHGIEVLRGECLEPPAGRVHGPLADLIGQASAPVDAAVDPSTATLRTSAGVVDEIERRATARPLLLVVEDLHWADDALLHVVHGLEPLVDQLPLSVLITSRPVPGDQPAASALRRLERRPGAVRIDLGPLDDDEVVALATAAAGAPPAAARRDALRRAGGNPLYVLTLATTTDDDLDSDGLPSSLRAAVLRRLGALPGGCLETLRVAAMLGTTFAAADLSIAMGTSSVRLASQLRPAIDAGVVTETDAGLSFQHDVVRDALYTDVPLDLRRGIHREIAEALAAVARPPASVAPHLLAAAHDEDPAAADEMFELAEKLVAQHLSLANELVAAALRVAPPDWPRREHGESRLAMGDMWAGRLTEAEHRARSLTERAREPMWQFEARRTLGNVLMRQGRFDEAIEHYQVLLAALDGLPDLAAMTAAELAGWGAHCGRRDVLEGWHRTSAGAPLDENPYTACLTLMGRSQHAHLEGDIGAAVDLATQATAMMAPTPAWGEGNPSHPLAPMVLGFALADADRLDDAVATFGSWRTITEKKGWVTQLPLYQWGLAIAHYLAGRWDDAIVEAEVGCSLTQTTGAAFGLPAGVGVTALVHLHRGDAGAAAACVADAPATPVGRPLFALAAAMLSGDARSAWEVTQRHGHLLFARIAAVPGARAAIANGDAVLAESIAATMSELACRSGVTGAAVVATHCDGLVRGDATAVAGAAEAARGGARPLEHAYACEDAALLMARYGQIDSARALLREGCDAFDALGATGDARRATASLRAVGVHRGKRSSNARHTVGWESVTPTERRVAALVAEGLTSRQIGERLHVSRYTVDTHVANLMRKLGAPSRAAVAAEVARHAATQPLS